MRHLTIYTVILLITVLFLVYKLGEILFNKAVYLVSEYEIEPKYNKQLDAFGLKRYLLDKSYQLTKGNI